MRFIKNTLIALGEIAIISGLVFLSARFFGFPNEKTWQNIRFNIENNPILKFLGISDDCRFPIAYSIGRIDPDFQVSKSELEIATLKATALWAKASGKILFAETATGPLKISLIYDERQKETDVLKKLGLSVDQGRSAFDSLEATYKKMKVDYMTLSSEYDQAKKDFEAQKTELQTAVSYWNNRGGAPKNEYDKLQARQRALENSFAELDAKRLALNARVKDLNQVGAILNQMAKELNIKVAEYNSGGQVVRSVFEAGLYTLDQTGEKIYVYQFEDKNKLQSILAHEFGHALGLEHNDDKTSIMYKLNQGQVQTITKTDIESLIEKCPNLK